MSPATTIASPSHASGMAQEELARTSSGSMKSALKRTPKGRGGRQITWNDANGKDLTQVLEFELSDTDDDDDVEFEEKPSCCVIA